MSYFLVPTKMDDKKGDNLNPQVATTTTTVPPTTATTAAPTTTTTAKKIAPKVAPPQAAAPEPALANSGANFGLPLTVGALLTVAGIGLLAQARRRRTAED